jgi:3-oxoacyl-[acyl-carrier-protein] synthase II
MENKIVITGTGIVSPAGIGRAEVITSLKENRSGIAPITSFDTHGFQTRKGAEVKDFDPLKFMDKKGLHYLTRGTRFLISAAGMALKEGNLRIETTNRFGIILGSTFANLSSSVAFDKEALTDHPRYVNPALFPNTMLSTPASKLAITYGLKGINRTITTGETAGLDALDYAVDLLKTSEAEAILACGMEELSYELYYGLYTQKMLSGSAMSPDESIEEISTPYDKRRNGIIPGEGAAVCLVETYDHARRRGAVILGEIAGTGKIFDPGRQKQRMGNPAGWYLNPGPCARAMEKALKEASLPAAGVDYISGAGNSSIYLDQCEIAGVKKLFAHESGFTISSIKGLTGECISASGIMQVCASLYSLRENFIPALAGFREKDPDCWIDGVFALKTENREIHTVLINALGPAGHTISVLLRK